MEIIFTAELKKFGRQGEKTGWTYITVPQKIADKIKPGTKRSYRVKGFIDKHPINEIALIPMGEGDFIIAVNATMRKAICKGKGAHVKVKLQEDKNSFILSPVLMTCLEDDPNALSFFNTLLPSHQRYFSKWIESAKLEPTRIKRIAMAVNALSKKLGYNEMLRAAKNDN